MPIRGTLSVRDRPMPGRRASPSSDSEPSESHGRVPSRGRNRGSSSRGTHRGNSTSPDLLVHRPWLEPGGGVSTAARNLVWGRRYPAYSVLNIIVKGRVLR